MRLLILVLLVLFVISRCSAGRIRSLSKEEDLELERQLKILNKPPVQTFQTRTGDIFDCIDIYKQPAFDNPLLKNHKIQLTPNFVVEETSVNKVPPHIKFAKTELEVQGKKCPTGTVPIRRTKKDELIRAKDVSKPKFNYPHTPMPYQSMQWATDSYTGSSARIYGAKALISLHKPAVEPYQFSTGQIAVIGQVDNVRDDNSIQVGWTVYPELYGDNETRLFSYWTADAYREKGCFNMLCTGFVQTDSTITFGDIYNQVSVYNGQQYVAMVMLKREPQTGNWWLMLNDENKGIGYWPRNLFTHMAEYATYATYGGVGGATYKKKFPPIGNGYYSQYNYKKAAYISNMKVINESGSAIDFDTRRSGTVNDYNHWCYGIDFYGYDGSYMEMSMTYGGPGGYCR